MYSFYLLLFREQSVQTDNEITAQRICYLLLITDVGWLAKSHGLRERGTRNGRPNKSPLLRWQTKSWPVCMKHKIPQAEHNLWCPENQGRKDQVCPRIQKITTLLFCESDQAYCLTLLSTLRFSAPLSDLKDIWAHMLLCYRYSCQQQYKQRRSL